MLVYLEAYCQEQYLPVYYGVPTCIIVLEQCLFVYYGVLTCLIVLEQCLFVYYGVPRGLLSGSNVCLCINVYLEAYYLGAIMYVCVLWCT